MKSIRAKITLCLILTVLTALLATGISSIVPNYRSTINTVDHMMNETAVLAAERVEQELTAYKNVAMDTGCIPQLSDSTVSVNEKKSIIEERSSMHNFQRGNIIGMDGISIFDGKDYSDREYVKQAMQGNVYVSEPLISKITGELSIMVAAPLYSGGIHGSSIAGVVYFVPHETFLNDIVSSIKATPLRTSPSIRLQSKILKPKPRAIPLLRIWPPSMRPCAGAKTVSEAMKAQRKACL